MVKGREIEEERSLCLGHEPSLNFTNKRWKKEKKKKRSNERKKNSIYKQNTKKKDGQRKKKRVCSLIRGKTKYDHTKEEKRIKKFAQHHQAFVCELCELSLYMQFYFLFVEVLLQFWRSNPLLCVQFLFILLNGGCRREKGCKKETKDLSSHVKFWMLCVLVLDRFTLNMWEGKSSLNYRMTWRISLLELLSTFAISWAMKWWKNDFILWKFNLIQMKILNDIAYNVNWKLNWESQFN